MLPPFQQSLVDPALFSSREPFTDPDFDLKLSAKMVRRSRCDLRPSSRCPKPVARHRRPTPPSALAVATTAFPVHCTFHGCPGRERTPFQSWPSLFFFTAAPPPPPTLPPSHPPTLDTAEGGAGRLPARRCLAALPRGRGGGCDTPRCEAGPGGQLLLPVLAVLRRAARSHPRLGPGHFPHLPPGPSHGKVVCPPSPQSTHTLIHTNTRTHTPPISRLLKHTQPLSLAQSHTSPNTPSRPRATFSRAHPAKDVSIVLCWLPASCFLLPAVCVLLS
jgi:hypothetical protein